MTLDHASQLQRRGHHTEAVEEIQNLRSKQGDSVECIKVLAEIYIAQGYLNHADSLLEAHGHDVSQGDEYGRWALSMIRCFTSAIVTAKIWTRYSQAVKVYSDATAMLKADPIAPHAVGRSLRSCPSCANTIPQDNN